SHDYRREQQKAHSEKEEGGCLPSLGFDPSTLTPLSPEVISEQATINLGNSNGWLRWDLDSQVSTGTIGYVAHGKSTVVKAISGVTTVRFTNELVRKITIKRTRYIRLTKLVACVDCSWFWRCCK
ncbi:hypothetical protein DFH08DRAFT_711072, partial [Mycena albidolilacea]